MSAQRERLIHVLTRIRDLGERSLFFVTEHDGAGGGVPESGGGLPETAAAGARGAGERGTAPAGAAPPPAARRMRGAERRRSGGGPVAAAPSAPGSAADAPGAAVGPAGVAARTEPGGVADPIEARWRDAEARVRACTRCRLCETRTHAVFGSGTRHTRLFVIGEGPGQQEDLRAEAFVGPAGQLLTKILNAVGFGRDEVFITNVVKCRPPGNRAPLPDEVEACAGYLEEPLELVKPAAILLLGASAARAVLRTTAPIGALRRVVHRLGEVPVLVTYHPAALLRNPEYKRPTWEDVQLLRRVHDERVAAGA
jgi:DNA polymerase